VRCQQLFSRASGAASRSATFSFGPSSVASLAASARPAHQPNTHFIVRERVIMDKNEVNVNAAIGNRMAECDTRKVAILSVLHCIRHRDIGPFVSSSGLQVPSLLTQCD
jgi:hypothetical protein